MAVYFLYRRIENIEYKLKSLKEVEKDDSKLIELSLPGEESNNETEIQLPLPEPETPSASVEKQENFDTISFPFNSVNYLQNSVSSVQQLIVEQNVEPVVEQNVEPVVEQNVEPVVEQNVEPVVEQNVEPVVEQNVEPVVEPDVEENNIDININDNLNFEKFAEVENMINEVENIDLSNIDNTLEEYSNEQSDVQIYSNDNEEDHHSSLMESMVEAVNDENSNQVELDSLLKNNKLAELQQMAENLSINIHKENSKKKTKLELATDILNLQK